MQRGYCRRHFRGCFEALVEDLVSVDARRLDGSCGEESEGDDSFCSAFEVSTEDPSFLDGELFGDRNFELAGNTSVSASSSSGGLGGDAEGLGSGAKVASVADAVADGWVEQRA